MSYKATRKGVVPFATLTRMLRLRLGTAHGRHYDMEKIQ